MTDDLIRLSRKRVQSRILTLDACNWCGTSWNVATPRTQFAKTSALTTRSNATTGSTPGRRVESDPDRARPSLALGDAALRRRRHRAICCSSLAAPCRCLGHTAPDAACDVAEILSSARFVRHSGRGARVGTQSTRLSASDHAHADRGATGALDYARLRIDEGPRSFVSWVYRKWSTLWRRGVRHHLPTASEFSLSGRSTGAPLRRLVSRCRSILSAGASLQLDAHLRLIAEILHDAEAPF